MKIDWKYFATTPGYKSLKAAYTDSITEKNKSRSKKEYLATFHWAINRAKHYAHVKGVPIWDILDDWEAKRSMWWFGYYRDSYHRKIHSNQLQPRGLQAELKYLKGYGRYRFCPRSQRNSVLSTIRRHTPKTTLKTKPRWTKDNHKWAAQRRRQEEYRRKVKLEKNL